MNIREILKSNNNRVTPERVAIFDFLKTQHLFTYNDIVNNFSGISRASVFRTLHLFLDIWVIKKVEVWEKTMTYEINDTTHPHEHMVCKLCDETIDYNAEDIYKKIFEEAEKAWFEINYHNIWVSWTCKQCL